MTATAVSNCPAATLRRLGGCFRKRATYLGWDALRNQFRKVNRSTLGTVSIMPPVSRTEFSVSTTTASLHGQALSRIFVCRPPVSRQSRHCLPTFSCMITHDTTAATEWHELQLKHVLESQQFSQAALSKIFATATEMEAVKRGTPAARQLEGYIMSTLFYEPSTRTRLSFESAMSRLGGTVLSTESAGEYSSAAKGETLEGTML